MGFLIDTCILIDMEWAHYDRRPYGHFEEHIRYAQCKLRDEKSELF